MLDEIMAHKRQELRTRRRAVPLADLRARGTDQPPPLDFAPALQGRSVGLIAEVKRASPSRGVLCPDFDPVGLAKTYTTSGAVAISVLTDDKFFQGKLEYLARIRGVLGPTVPLLRKDFIFDPYQIYEARAYGADALLFIVAILSDKMLARLLTLTREIGMAALVEVHNEEEIERVLPLRPQVVGINNRNLRDFSVDLATFERLRPLLPDGTVAVAESGVRTAADVRRLAVMGADAVLVGEALVTAPERAAKVQELVKGGIA